MSARETLTEKFWDAYKKDPVLREEFVDDQPKPEYNGVLYPEDDFARWTADAIGCQPSDWNNSAYREMYEERLIVAEIANTFWLVRGGKGGVKALDKFVDKHRGAGITVHKHNPVEDVYAIEATPEIARQMKELEFEMRPIKPGGDNRRAR